MQFQVPQFIDVEDHIVGPLTLRQFGYIAAGGFLLFLLFFPLELWLWLIVSTPIAILTFAFSFLSYHGRPFSSIFSAAFGYLWKPRVYLWARSAPKIHTAETIHARALSHIVEKHRETPGSALLQPVSPIRQAPSVNLGTRQGEPTRPTPSVNLGTRQGEQALSEPEAVKPPALPSTPTQSITPTPIADDDRPVQFFDISSAPTDVLVQNPTLSNLNFKLAVFSKPLPGREMRVPAMASVSKPTRLSFLSRIMHEREAARRVDYR